MRERGDAHRAREGSVDSEGVKRFLIDFAFVHPSLSLELSRQLDPNLMQGVDISLYVVVAFPIVSPIPLHRPTLFRVSVALLERIIEEGNVR